MDGSVVQLRVVRVCCMVSYGVGGSVLWHCSVVGCGLAGFGAFGVNNEGGEFL